MPLLEYEAGTTLFHRMSPIVKFFWGMIVLLWLFLMFNPQGSPCRDCCVPP